MFKRRFAVLGAVAVLVMTGLGGSAMAAEEPPAPGAKVVCTTIDGKAVAVQITEAKRAGAAGRAYPATPSDGEVRTLEKGELHVTKLLDGEALAVTAVPAVPATKMPADGEMVRATAPLQATDADGKPVAVRAKDFDGKAVDVTKLAKTSALEDGGILCKTTEK